MSRIGLIRFLNKLRRWRSSLFLSRMVEADALILSCQLTGATHLDMLQVLLLLQISPKQGRNYIVEYKTYFPQGELQDLGEGLKIKIHFWPGNPRKILLIRHASEELSILDN
jgi:hypothetical protein